MPHYHSRYHNHHELNVVEGMAVIGLGAALLWDLGRVRHKLYYVRVRVSDGSNQFIQLKQLTDFQTDYCARAYRQVYTPPVVTPKVVVVKICQHGIRKEQYCQQCFEIQNPPRIRVTPPQHTPLHPN